MAESASIVPDLETQKKVISNFLKKQFEKDDIWCLIDNTKWFKQWKNYVGYDSSETADVGDCATHPGPIDNSPLLRDDGSNEIKDHLRNEDFDQLPEEAWNLLVQWYGMTEGQLVIARKVVEFGMFIRHFKVEVYLVEFNLYLNHDPEHVENKKFSLSDTIEFIEKEMRSLFNIHDEKETRLSSSYYDSDCYQYLSDKERTVYDFGLRHGQVLIIEERNDDGTWPRRRKIMS